MELVTWTRGVVSAVIVTLIETADEGFGVMGFVAVGRGALLASFTRALRASQI